MPNLKYKEPCYYCGNETTSIKTVQVFGEKHKLPVCSNECSEELIQYSQWDAKHRLPAYLVLFVAVVFNMLVLGFGWKYWWGHLSLTVIGITLFFYPLILFRFSSYMKYGVRKTLDIIRFAGVLIAIIGIILTVLNKVQIG